MATVAPELASLFRPSVQPYLISVARIDPVAQIRDFSIPTLLVQGTTDLQIKTGDAKALAAAQPTAKIALIQGMNHVLKMAQGDVSAQARSYLDPSLPLPTTLIKQVTRFILDPNAPAKGNVPDAPEDAAAPNEVPGEVPGVEAPSEDAPQEVE